MFGPNGRLICWQRKMPAQYPAISDRSSGREQTIAFSIVLTGTKRNPTIFGSKMRNCAKKLHILTCLFFDLHPQKNIPRNLHKLFFHSSSGTLFTYLIPKFVVFFTQMQEFRATLPGVSSFYFSPDFQHVSLGMRKKVFCSNPEVA